jgi:hypothetical protein
MGTRIALGLLVVVAALAGCQAEKSTAAPKAEVSSVRTPPPPATLSIDPGQGCTGPARQVQRSPGKDLVTVTADPRSLASGTASSSRRSPPTC